MGYIPVLLLLALGVAGSPFVDDVFTPYVDVVDPPTKRQLGSAAPDRALNVTWGPSLDVGFTSSTIVKFSTVFSPGYPPRPEQMKGIIYLWPGLWDPRDRSHTNLIQSVVEYTPPEKLRGVCSPRPGQWCIRPFVVDFSQKEYSAYAKQGAAIDAQDKILIDYAKAPGTNGNWVQTITNLSKGNRVLFRYERGNKPANWMRLATEYQLGNTIGTTDTQNYWNTTMILQQPDQRFGSTMKAGGQIKPSKIHTPDGGKTWIIDHVTIPAKTPGAAWRPS